MHDSGPPATGGWRLAFAITSAALSASMGFAVLVGWALDLPSLRSFIPGAVEMKANTAIGIVAASLALALLARVPSRLQALPAALAVFVMLLGGATLGEYLFGWQLGIDELLVRDTGAAFNQIKGRMSPYSAVAFTALGIALLGLARRRAGAAVRIGGGLVVSIGLISVLGYLWNATEIVTDRIVPPVAINTAFALVLLGAATYLSRKSDVGLPLRSQRSRLETLVLGGLVPTALLVVIGGGLTYEAGASFAAAAERVAHTQQVRAELGRLRMLLADAETAQRNLILTGETGYAGVSSTLASQALGHLGKLGRLVADNPQQVSLQRELVQQVDRRLAAVANLGDVYRLRGADQARAMLTQHVQTVGAQSIAPLIDQMDDAESGLLAARLSRFEERRVATLVALLGTFGLLAALFSLLFRAIRHEMIGRASAEEAVHQLNQGLEQRIVERTEELSHQRAFLRRVIDLDRNLIFAKDREGRFVLANQALADSLDTSVESLIGATEGSLRPGAGDVAQHESADMQVLDSGLELVNPEYGFVDHQGRTRWLSSVKRPMLAADGQSTIVLGVAVDITERVNAENQILQLNADLEQRVAARTRDLHESNQLLRQARLDAEAANRAKSAFLANMSHEIRTPMNAVIGLTHLMLREARERLQRERLGKIGDAAQHLLQVINDILDMSKIEAGKMTLERVEFSLDEVISNSIAMVSGLARDKGLELILDPDSLPNHIVGDPTRLSQVLINLLSNAVKFTEHGWVRLRGEIAAEDPAGVEIRFEVQDTGPGIPLERQRQLFSAFEQADASTSRQHGGSGLGLALSRQLARAMGGDAGVVSAPGSGSAFWFTSRFARGTQAARRTASALPTGLSVLLVDDLPEARGVIGDCLRLLGMDVDEQASGEAALARVQAEVAVGRCHDLMVIDWRMSPMDGLKTLEAVRLLLGEGTPPAVLVTAFDDAALVERAHDAGYQAVLLKPITSSSLHDAVVMALDRGRSEPEPAAPGIRGEDSLRERHAGQRVMLAEDNPVNREVAEELLGAVGLVVETAGDGARAVEMALSRSYDLVLMDVQMPIMDGLEAAREIRARAGHAVPIIAMTANAFAEDRAATLEAGMNDHVPKPVDPSLLYQKLLRWLPLRRSAPVDEPVSDFGGLDAMDVRARLEAVPGIDLGQALHHVAGQLSPLVRVLRRFASTYRHGLPSLVDTGGADADQRQRCKAACHSVRGALGTIGASGLLARVTQLEQALAGGQPVAGLLGQREALHRDLLALVAALDGQLAG